MTADGSSPDDATALAHLGLGPNNPVNGGSVINVTTANLRAIGIPVGLAPGQPDGFIGLDTEDYLRMVCIEAAQIGSPVELKPGTSWSASQTLAIV